MYDFEAARRYYCHIPEDHTRWAAWDTETTGTAFRHGDNCFMVSLTYDDGESHLWTGRVDPFTRKATFSLEDKAEIKGFFAQKGVRWVMTNKKFDIRAIKQVVEDWDDEEFMNQCDETFAMHHALNNLESHALKDAAVKHAGIPDLDEKELHEATRQALIEAKQLGWKVASVQNCHIRKAPDKGFAVMDMWVPAELARYKWEHSEAYKGWLQIQDERDEGPLSIGVPDYETCLSMLSGWEWHPPEVCSRHIHPYYTLCGKYCSYDTLRSVILAKIFVAQLHKEGLYDIYLESQLNCLMTYKMENYGVSFNRTLAQRELKNYKMDEANAKNAVNYSISPLFPTNVDSPDQLRNILYGPTFGLKVTRYTVNKKDRDAEGKPVTDEKFFSEIISKIKHPEDSSLFVPRFTPGIDTERTYFAALRKWHTRLTTGAPDEVKLNQLFAFCCSVLQAKKAGSAISQIEGYLFNELDIRPDGFSTLHQSINPFGTETTRQTHSNPNGGNISKGGKHDKAIEFLLRVNRTLRILFGPRSGREWWSVDYSQLQLVIFAVYAKDDLMVQAFIEGRDLHDLTARRFYGYPTSPSDPNYHILKPSKGERDKGKEFNFAFIFGAQQYRLSLIGGTADSYDILCNSLPSAVSFLDRMEWEVRNKGYVKTLGGYRLYVKEDFAYKGACIAVQGTEGLIAKRAMYGTQHYIDTKIRDNSRFYLTLPVHDELDFDSELSFGEQHIGNICSIMEDSALSFGVPAKVNCKYITTNWSEGDAYVFDEPLTMEAI